MERFTKRERGVMKILLNKLMHLTICLFAMIMS